MRLLHNAGKSYSARYRCRCFSRHGRPIASSRPGYRCRALSAGGSGEEQLLAANLDVLFLVSSLNLDLNPSRLERFLAAAALPGCQPVLLLTKSDLCDCSAAAVADLRTRLGDVPVHAVSALTGDGLGALAPYLSCGRTAAMLGSVLMAFGLFGWRARRA